MLLKLKNVSKFYYSKGVIATGFSKVNINFDIGEFVVITGASGSGKSTLLNVISGLDTYEEGEMYINDEETSHYREIDFENYRKKYVSNIFQNFNLVNSYTVYQNIELVLLLNGYKRKEVSEKVLELIKKVNLTRYKNTKVSKLSGGQKQRVAIARALAKETPIIICDEPTGSLDSRAAHEIIKILKDISENKLVIVVTHDYPLVSEFATRVIEMHDGKILSDKRISDIKEKQDINIRETNNIGLFNIIRLGIRNTFNIIPKFILIFLVNLFIIISLLSEYSSLEKSKYEESLNGYNGFFHDTSDTRIVAIKENKDEITFEDINKIKELKEVDKVVLNDFLIDTRFYFTSEDYNYYLYGMIKDIEEFEGIPDIGRMPQNDNEVLVYSNSYDYDLLYNSSEMLKKTYYEENNNTFISFKIVGIKYQEEDNYTDDSIIYGTSSFVKGYANNSLKNITSGKITLNSKEYDLENTKGSTFSIYYSDKVPRGNAYVYEELNFNCKNYNCKNQSLKLDIENIYYKESNKFKITNVYNDDNVKKLLEITKKNGNYKSIYINTIDYQNLFDKGTYQISVYATNKDTVSDLVNNLTILGYKPLEIRKTLVNDFEEFVKIISIVQVVITALLIVTLFFIAYFVIKLILKSRNIYFSTLRILGANNSNLKKIMDVELIANASLAYIIYMFIIYFVKIKVINSETITEMLTYLHLGDYIIIYIILIITSFLISTRFSRKIFKGSAMKNYKEEV